MTLKNFLYTCNSNSLFVTVFDKYDDIVYEGPMYLVSHVGENTLNSSVEAWWLEYDDSISVCTDFEVRYS